jgi:hypothetical protein
MRTIKKFFAFLALLEQERIKAMIHTGKGFN